MRFSNSLLLAIGASAFMACTDNPIIGDSSDQGEFSVVAELEPLAYGIVDDTRVIPTDKGDGHYGFSWQANDKIAIYGQSSNSSGWGFFQLSGDGGDAAGVFSGIFKMTNETTYYSFYPPRNFTSETSPSTILLDYSGQTQIKDGDMSHLRDFIYYAAAQADDGRFKFKHVGALLKITLPDEHGDDCTSVTLSASGDGKFVTTGKIDLTNTTTTQPPSVIPIETSSTFSVGYSHGSSANTGTITVYAMIAPTDLSNCDLTVTAFHNNSSYNKNYSVSPQTFLAGKPYTLVGTKLVEIEDVVNGYDYVDLGLPSGLLWATCNIGAETPEEFGDYYAWGEITPKSSYSRDNYSFYNNSTYNYTYQDISSTSFDVASSEWKGEWRMPSFYEATELFNFCTVQDEVLNGQNGIRLTSIFNGNSIFLPKNGYRNNDTTTGKDRYCNYWTSSICEDYGTPHYFDSSSALKRVSGEVGLSIRPVCPSPIISNAEPEAVDLGLSVKWATINIGATNLYDIGDKYAWGEVITKDSFSWENYKFGTKYSITKYNSTDQIASLVIEDDAASANWGNSWRMPTKSEYLELFNNTTIKRRSYVYGRNKAIFILTSTMPGFEDKFIIMPFMTIEGCNYWTRSAYGNRADSYYDWMATYANIGFDPSVGNATSRCEGWFVRAVIEQ